jgi:hypothetical protein
MRKSLSGILLQSLLFLAARFGISSPIEADEYNRGSTRIDESDIQPYDRSDREMMNPDNTYSSPENVKAPKEKATEDSDSYQRPSQKPHRFGSGTSSEFYLFRKGR